MQPLPDAARRMRPGERNGKRGRGRPAAPAGHAGEPHRRPAAAAAAAAEPVPAPAAAARKLRLVDEPCKDRIAPVSRRLPPPDIPAGDPNTRSSAAARAAKGTSGRGAVTAMLPRVIRQRRQAGRRPRREPRPRRPPSRAAARLRRAAAPRPCRRQASGAAGPWTSRRAGPRCRPARPAAPAAQALSRKTRSRPSCIAPVPQASPHGGPRRSASGRRHGVARAPNPARACAPFRRRSARASRRAGRPTEDGRGTARPHRRQRAGLPPRRPRAGPRRRWIEPGRGQQAGAAARKRPILPRMLCRQAR